MRANRDGQRLLRLAQELTNQELSRQGKESVAEIPVEARQGIAENLSAELKDDSAVALRALLLEMWTGAQPGLTQAQKAQLGWEEATNPSAPAATLASTEGVLSPLAAVRFQKTAKDAAQQAGLEPGASVEKVPVKKWDENKIARGAAYWLRRMTGRLPALQRGEAVLRDPDATILRKRRLGGGINASFILEMSNGAKGVWKPSAAEYMKQLRDCVEEDHQARREAAAYIVDSWMGHLAQVPPTVYREVEGDAGALMEFVDAKPPDLYSPKRDTSIPLRNAGPEFDDYRHLAIFDHVIGNLDRHSNNWMVKSDGELIPIDHGLAFPLQNGKPGGHKFYFSKPLKLRPEEISALTQLLTHRAEVEAELAPLLSPDAVASMFERVETMLSKGETDNAWRDGGSEWERAAQEGLLPAE